ncbi:MAG TPA: hypothetical protein PLO37_10430 [Candidatus Hydrogenedentes bacterium]|nr:hypothetical protein [Candidatus Hydrogenedentota bacterium]HPG67251.1 hypothetical protein [Candidatus Hydrogenedentota bacterium]
MHLAAAKVSEWIDGRATIDTFMPLVADLGARGGFDWAGGIW